MTVIGLSGEFIRPGQVGGAEQAFRHWATGVVTAASDDAEVIVLGTGSDLARVRAMPSPRPLPTRFATEVATLWKMRRNLGVAFYPNYFTPWVPGAPPRVTAILDLQYRHLPENFSRRKRVWLRLAHEMTLRSATRVTTLSNCVRDDMIDQYGSVAERVEVVPVPVDFSTFGTEPLPPRRAYVLGVASHYRHKNLSTLVRAFARIAPKWPDVDLVLVGQLAENLVGVRRAEDVKALVAELGIGDRVEATGYTSESRLGALYRGAELFVFPSIFEGFGMPPVEALGMGLPVITTTRTAIPEVTLGLATYVDDPFDIDELAQRMDAHLESPTRPPESTVERIRDTYSPERIGKQLYDILIAAAHDGARSAARRRHRIRTNLAL